MRAIIEHPMLKIFLCALMLATLFTGLQASSKTSLSPAFAIDGCGSVGACLGTVAAVVVGGASGGPISIGGGNSPAPVAVGPSGEVSAPAIPEVRSPGSGEFVTKKYVLRVMFEPRSVAYGYGCPDKTISGFLVRPSGIVITQQKNFIEWNKVGGEGQEMAVYGPFKTISTTCVYPPNPQIIGTNKTCILSYSATVNRLANSRLGAANGLAAKSRTVTSVAALEADGMAGCKQTENVSLAYNPPNGQNGWGQYSSQSSIRQVTCNFATTTFEGVVDQLGKCSNQRVVPGTTGYMTIWCDGYVNYLVNKDWSGSDCFNGKNARLSCSIPTKATYNGYTTNPQALRDGNDGLVRWGTPVVNGGWGMTNWRSSTVVNAGSSPRKTNISDNSASQQLFKSSIPFSSSMSKGQNLNQQLRFYTAGDAGAPFSMTRNYRYDAWFNAVYTQIRSIDLRSGKITATTSIRPAFATNNKCGPQVSPRIDVVRAIGDAVIAK